MNKLETEDVAQEIVNDYLKKLIAKLSEDINNRYIMDINILIINFYFYKNIMSFKYFFSKKL